MPKSEYFENKKQENNICLELKEQSKTKKIDRVSIKIKVSPEKSEET